MNLGNMKCLAALVAAVGILAGTTSVNAVQMSMTVDQILNNPVSGTLSGTVTMEAVDGGNTLTIFLRNTSVGATDTGANVILSGLAFNMDDALNIASGTVVVGNGGSTIVGGPLNGMGAGTSVSGEWGYVNGVSGHFNGLAVDTQVSAMEADTATPFSNTPVENPAVLNGPEYGLLSTGTGGAGGGNTTIRDRVVITLTLNGTIANATAFLTAINNGLVALTFGSPTGVPDSGATVGLLGLAMLGIGVLRRQFAKNA